jgi:uncharacterized protein
METADVLQLKNWLAAETQAPVQQLETHISWILLTDSLAYKIKKPVRFSYLDFTDQEVRHSLCRRELLLNQRLAPEVYLAVSPVVRHHQQVQLGTQGEVLDYAIVMKRLEQERLLVKLLATGGEVPLVFMEHLARKLAEFHQAGPPTHAVLYLDHQKNDFAELLEHADWLGTLLGPDWAEKAQAWTQLFHRVIGQFGWRMQERIEQGFQRDGHGDLHAGNIFMYEQDPVVFDCLEFKDEYRLIDVLNDIAFLCMDLDLYQQPVLRKTFLETYNEHFPVIRQLEDVILLKYFCMQRACIRLRIEIAKARATPAGESTSPVPAYAHLLDQYTQQMQSLIDHYITYEKEVAPPSPLTFI